jgi:Pin2-interacting protein X1
LAKYGWDRASGQGLGANGDGRTKHISVVQKLNSMGIGGTKAGGPDTIAWKQNRDFEMVLKRLNVEDDDAEDEEEQAEKKKKKKSDTSAAQAYLQGFVRAKRIEGTIENAEVVIAEEDDDPSIMKAKRSDKKKKRKEDAQAEVPDEKDIPKIVPRAA